MLTLSQFQRQDLEAWADNGVYSRAEDYAADGSVHLDEVDAEHVTATVEGTEEYTVEIEADISNTAFCDCPYEGFPCKHIIAVLMCYRNVFPILAKKSSRNTAEKGVGLKPAGTALMNDGTVAKKKSTRQKLASIDDRGEATSKTAKKKLTPVEATLEKSTWRELYDFVVERTKKDRAFRSIVLLHFEKDQTLLAKSILSYAKSITPAHYSSALMKNFDSAFARAVEKVAALDQPERRDVEWALAEMCAKVIGLQYRSTTAIVEMWTTMMLSVTSTFEHSDDPELRQKYSRELIMHLAKSNDTLNGRIVEAVDRMQNTSSERLTLMQELLKFTKGFYLKSDVFRQWAYRIMSTVDDPDAAVELALKSARSGDDITSIAEIFFGLGQSATAEKILLYGTGLKETSAEDKLELADMLSDLYLKDNRADKLFELFERQIALLNEEDEEIDEDWIEVNLESGAHNACFIKAVQQISQLYPKYLSVEKFESVIDLAFTVNGSLGLQFFELAGSFQQPYKELVRNAIIQELSSMPAHRKVGRGRETETILSESGLELARIYDSLNMPTELYALVQVSPDAMLAFTKTLEKDYTKEMLALWKSDVEANLRERGHRSYFNASRSAKNVRRIMVEVINDPTMWKMYLSHCTDKHPELLARSNDWRKLM